MATTNSNWSIAAYPTRFLPSCVTPYLRKISRFSLVQDTALALRFVRRFLTYQVSRPTTTTDPLTFSFRGPRETEGDSKVRGTLRSPGLSPNTTPKIFANGLLAVCGASTHSMDGTRMDGNTRKKLASKILIAARARLNESRKSRSSTSKSVSKGKDMKRKPFKTTSRNPSTESIPMDVDSNGMVVDDPRPSPRHFPASAPHPLARSESMVSCSASTGVTITRKKRKLESADESELVIKRLRLSVSMTSAAPHLPVISTETILTWVQSQPSVHHLAAEHLRAFFVPSSLSEKLHRRRMRKLTPIVNDIGFVIRSPYLGNGSCHWLILKDDVHAKIAPHLDYTRTVAHVMLGRAESGTAPRRDSQPFSSRARKRSPLMNEL